MTDARDRIDADFSIPDVTINPAEFNPYRETLRVCNRIIDLLDRIIDENGVK
ncbi:hypothetical protein [Microbacterium sp.]|uniref:hypothetical protein n=1 Tax=Microbacterium sp. TaxID=51671 RepID=UPI003C72C488